MTLRLVAQPNGLLIPVDDLRLKNLPNRDLIVGDDLQIVLANLMGFDGNQPRLLKVDSNSNLKVTIWGSTGVGGVPVPDVMDNVNFENVQWAGLGPALGVAARMRIVNGGPNNAVDSWGEASALKLVTLTSANAGMVAGPGQWSTSGNAGVGALSSASRAPAAAGVRHVLTGYEIIVSSQVAPAAGQLTINIRDGASGAGTIIEQLVVQLPAALYAPIVIPKSGKALVGSAATAMTIEQSVGYAAVGVSITMEGYDAS